MDDQASRIVIADTKRAFYFGCWDNRIGHYFHDSQGKSTLYHFPEGFPWTIGHLDGTLLKNGKRPDVYDGKVFWTCGGTPLWLAFCWWDNSVDSRGASNSGFYVQGFGHKEPQAALDFACEVFPKVVARQKHPLVLQIR